MATLELVMIFPFLMLLVAALFFVARAVAARTTGITQVRHDAFARRDQANPGTILGLTDNPLASMVTATATQPVAGGPTFPGTTFQAQALGSTTGRTWGTFGPDQQEVSFQLSTLYFAPSPDPFNLLSSYTGLPDLSLFTTMNPATNSALSPFSSLASLLQQTIGNNLSALNAVPAAINSMPVCQVALQNAQAAVAAGGLFQPQVAAQLEMQIQMLTNLINTAEPCLASLIAANNGAPCSWNSNLGGQLNGTQIDLSVLTLLNQVAAFAP
jgi:hypothetical protein